jgi:hypothetical protein
LAFLRIDQIGVTDYILIGSFWIHLITFLVLSLHVLISHIKAIFILWIRNWLRKRIDVIAK